MEEKIKRHNGFVLHFIPTKKFKTVQLTAKFRAPLEKSTITKRALLPYLLQQGTENYPNSSALQQQLDKLYGAVLSASGAKKGNDHILTVRLETANQKYLQNENGILGNMLALFREVIYHPLSNENGFDEKVFKREKQTLKQKMAAIADDKMNYANMRLVDEMCKDEVYHLHVHGYETDLEKLTSSETYAYYQDVLAHDDLTIYVTGDVEQDEVEQFFATHFSREQVRPVARQQEKLKPISRVQEVIERQAIQQAKLHIGYRTNIVFSDEDYPALHVFNGLFGGFPSSKLFINVREKNSLAYYASTRIESHKGLLFVFSGIAPADYSKAREIIEQQLTAMRDGDFTEDDLAKTKELIVNQLLETMDNPVGLVEISYQKVLGNSDMDPEQLIAAIKRVTKEQVVAVAGKIQEDTVYLLTDQGGGQ